MPWRQRHSCISDMLMLLASFCWAPVAFVRLLRLCNFIKIIYNDSYIENPRRVISPSLGSGQVHELKGDGLGDHAVLDPAVQSDRVDCVRATGARVQEGG